MVVKMNIYNNFFRGIAYIGYSIVFLFAVYTFEQSIPDKIYIKSGEEVSYEFDVPVTMELKEESLAASILKQGMISENSYTVTCRLFGIFPVKDVEVMFVDGDAVYAGGMPIGIYVKTDGVLVIGAGAVVSKNGEKEKPAENIVKAGDYIVSVNGNPVEKKEQLQQLVQEYAPDKIVLGLRRNGELIETAVLPVCAENGTYLLGIWVRDDLAGIGTMTFYKENGSFGALGHSASDGDTGCMLEIKEGSVYKASIIGIKKGQKGNPGELSGLIDYANSNRLGSIDENTEIGIYGVLDGNISALSAGDYYNICYKQDIKKGQAYVLSDFSGERKQYAIEIDSLDYSGRQENKGILFHVTDETLLSQTGGIVQGMSGSPIIQDGKLIGAVTHVLVNDPARGYGIFIENMLDAAG